MPLNIKSMVYINPTGLVITGVKTKKICCQDILTSKGVNIEALAPPYKPPKMIDLIKQGLTAVAAKDLSEELKKIEEKFREKDYLTKIKQALEEQGLKYALQPKITSMLTPSEVVLPIRTPAYNVPNVQSLIEGINLPSPVSYNPLAGGQQDITNVDLLNSVSEFNKRLTTMFNNITNNLMNTEKNFTRLETIVKEQGKTIMETLNTLQKAMTKDLVDYFRDTIIHMIKNGCTYLPVGVTGYLSLYVQNNTPLPIAVVLDNVIVKSGDYQLSSPTTLTVIAAPMERSTIKVPINVENIDAVDYIINARGKGTIPIQLIGRIKIGGMEENLNILSGNVEVR